MNVTNSFWAKKYRQHIAAMIGMCYRYVPDRATAEDLAHDAFLRAIEKADTLRLIERFDQWLKRITLNTVMDHLRMEQHAANVDAETLAAEIPEPEEDISPESMMEAIRQADFTQEEMVEAIAQLPEHHRTVLNLYVFEQLNHRQIAETLGISQNTSKSHLMRARKELQIILFEKSKKKKKLLMTWIVPFISTDAGFDRFCRRRVNGFSIQPKRPLQASDFPTAASSRLPLSVRFHNFRAPVAIGLGTAAIGAMVIPALPRHTNPPAPAAPTPAPTEITASTPAADSVMSEESPTMTVTPKAPALATAKTESNAENKLESETENESDTAQVVPTDDPAPAPVVVKKVLRRNKRTVVVKDPNNE